MAMFAFDGGDRLMQFAVRMPFSVLVSMPGLVWLVSGYPFCK